MNPQQAARGNRVPSRPSALVLSIHLALTGVIVAVAVQPGTLHAAESPSSARKPYAIAAGPLGDVLVGFAATAGVRLSFDPALLAGQRSSGLQGNYSVDEGFARILAGSGYERVELKAGAYALRKTPALAGAEAALPAVKVTAKAEVITYQAVAATSATRINAPLRDIPQTVNVVTAALIEDQGARSLQDTLQNVPGVSFHIGDGQRDQAYIRGFDAIGDQYVDGLRDDGLYYRDLSNIERVEVVKGPAAVLYGRGSSGGIINRVTKKPGPDAVREVELIAGSDDEKRATFDLGGAVNEVVDFRVAGAVERSGSFREEGFVERENFAPSLALRLSPDTRLLIQAEKLRDRRITDMGIPAFRGRPADVPRDTYYGTANAARDDYSEANVTSSRISLDHRINDSLSLRNHFGSYSYALDRQNTFAATVNESARTASLFHGATDRQDKGWFNQLELSQKLTAGSTRHQFLYGLEVGRQEKNFQSWNWSVRPTVDLFDPIRPDLGAFGSAVLANNNLTSMDVTSVYVQDLVTLSPQWKALLGLRHDDFRQQVQDRLAAQSDRERTDREWSPRAGVVFQPSDWQAWYLSYSRAFQPSGETLTFSSAQAEMAPEQTTNLEVGTKLDLLDGRVSATAAVFELERTDIKNTDPVSKALVAVGTQRTRGVELTLGGEIATGWQLSAGYAYLDARVTRSVAVQNGVALKGTRAALTPKHSANVWLMHALGHGFSLGGGLHYVGDRYASPDNLVTLDKYLTADAVLMYKTKAYDLALNLKNLTNEAYFISGHGASNNLNAPGAPRSVELTARVRF
jgi:catecholate siderophore receptor